MIVLCCAVLYDFVHCLLLRRNNKYIGYVQLPWEGEEENEGHGPDYLKWPRTRYYQNIQTIHQLFYS